MNELTQLIAQKGDLAHLALFLWASSSSALLVWSLRELVAANRRFNIFVGEIANLNRLFKGKN
ncbi:hypothetical protein MNBD_ALPHA11-1418 [hydrothermal vent metagenome]|uniref:Uncharacterized protein n=1 Tax=hydrothermal vent metagenome TaxID=652676 RepID=A0A3B0TZX7_9ZZZZ